MSNDKNEAWCCIACRSLRTPLTSGDTDNSAFKFDIKSTFMLLNVDLKIMFVKQQLMLLNKKIDSQINTMNAIKNEIKLDIRTGEVTNLLKYRSLKILKNCLVMKQQWFNARLRTVK